MLLLNGSFLYSFFSVAALVFLLRLLSKTSFFYLTRRSFHYLVDFFHVYQSYTVPQFNDNSQENLLYRKVSVYVHSLEDSDSANLFTGNKPNEINVLPDATRPVSDLFLGARVTWTHEVSARGEKSFVLRIRRNDRRRILRPYLQHVHGVSDEIESARKELRLYINSEPESGYRTGRWRSAALTHPSTMETIAMDTDLKTRIKSDLEQFLKSKQYYHRLGRVWKRSYLLYGPSGTGKSSFITAMAKFLSYDVYDVDLTRVYDDSDLKMLLMQTTARSLIVVEDLDRFFAEKNMNNVTLGGVLNFMDGVVSCCGEERIMIFTVNSKDRVNQDILRPGRVDVHIEFPHCDFSAFKTMANSHLGLKEHKLFSQVEEIFQTGASLSPAEISEIMISNRGSPSRALKSVITALQANQASRTSQRLSGSRSNSKRVEEPVEPDNVICRESVHTVREFRKLYGLLRRSGRREESQALDLNLIEKEASRPGIMN